MGKGIWEYHEIGIARGDRRLLIRDSSRLRWCPWGRKTTGSRRCWKSQRNLPRGSASSMRKSTSTFTRRFARSQNHKRILPQRIPNRPESPLESGRSWGKMHMRGTGFAKFSDEDGHDCAAAYQVIKKLQEFPPDTQILVTDRDGKLHLFERLHFLDLVIVSPQLPSGTKFMLLAHDYEKWAM
jgi:hypothetical protein